MPTTGVTQILEQIESGDPSAADELLPLVYDQLRELATARMLSERADHTLQATALVHEAYIRLVDVDKAQHWNSRGHFFSAAAEAMRRILVERARQKNSIKGGRSGQQVELAEYDFSVDPLSIDILALNEALEKLYLKDKLKADLVKLRFFAGLTVPQAAKVLGIASSTADKYWTYTKSWLYLEINGQPEDESF